MPVSGADARFGPARMMLARSFFAQNVAIGCSFGGFAVSVLSIEARYQSSRAMAEMLLAIALLTMSLLAPVVGGMIVRFGLRITMIAGVLLSAVGYVTLALAPTMPIALAAAAFLIGPGAGLFGSIPASILASGWYPHMRGKALGIANVPLFIALVPLLGLFVIQRFGLPAFFLCLAGLHMVLLPFMIGIKEPPAVSETYEGSTVLDVTTGHPLRRILSHGMFWLIVLGDGMLNAANITNSAHIIPIAVEDGVALAAATILLSVGGGASILGSILSGLLCDRIGASRTLALAAFGSAISWALIAATGWFPALMVAMLLSGMCGAAVFPPTNVLVTQIFGVSVVPRVLGLLSVFTLPLTFAMSPTVGWGRDMLGNYSTILISLAAICVLVTIQFLLIARAIDRRDGSSASDTA